ncbi:MAG: UDP-3-O-(3-hydroxymyristoyl)glucosamine N-acyltransferase [Saprospiraceae bacterium]|nr:UDP-3-O-(3-hydroxymyristoyl)glucosamine N-acyltransferase [Bacteroidia bacterium]NNE14090.1 UDP-3-O-(3-hydroxymyristoyl)glucosamine N-acyltransferase [Saprospiraceae bacterium]NNL92282.1 UDP-3-O-(3-hydroxymyristoyl)glucosamine N-acyltransferase [Saprospiraceae bacterium]
MTITVDKIAEQLGGVVNGDGKIIIKGASRLENAEKGHITFLSNDKYLNKAKNTNASAILVSKEWQDIDFDVPTIAVDNIYASLADMLNIFGEAVQSEYHISEFASVSKSAILHENISVGAFSVVSKGSQIGEGSQLLSHIYVGENVRIGKNCLIYPGVKIYNDCLVGDNCIIHANAIIGSDGFGFAPLKNGTFKKIPQIGNVVIGDNVEIGANTVVDRATMGSTVIRDGVKLDNLIQIAHNVEIGKDTVMAAQAGIAGSTKVGANCQIGGQTAIVGHISIADKTLIQGQSGMTKSVKKEGTKWYGTPAIEYNNYLKSFAIYKNLPDLESRIRALEKMLADLKDSSQ